MDALRDNFPEAALGADHEDEDEDDDNPEDLYKDFFRGLTAEENPSGEVYYASPEFLKALRDDMRTYRDVCRLGLVDDGEFDEAFVADHLTVTLREAARLFFNPALFADKRAHSEFVRFIRKKNELILGYKRAWTERQAMHAHVRKYFSSDGRTLKHMRDRPPQNMFPWQEFLKQGAPGFHAPIFQQYARNSLDRDIVYQVIPRGGLLILEQWRTASRTIIGGIKQQSNGEVLWKKISQEPLPPGKYERYLNQDGLAVWAALNTGVPNPFEEYFWSDAIAEGEESSLWLAGSFSRIGNFRTMRIRGPHAKFPIVLLETHLGVSRFSPVE